MSIPFVDLKAQYLTLKPQIDAAIQAVIEQTAFIRGPFVEAFEKSYAAEYGVRHCVSCADGTSAIYIALKQLGIGPGDEVITTANSWIASSEVVAQAGADIVFADVEEHFYNLNPAEVERKITPRTRAVIAVHLLGQPCDIVRIKEICDSRGIDLIEDCAQAHFATMNGRRVGTFGAVGTFSFYPGKNLGAYGDAGGIVTNDDELAAKMRCYARHGASPVSKHDHLMEGINSRLDGLQAAILSVKLPHIHEWGRKRAELAARYNELLADVPGVLETPQTRPGATHVFHAYVVRLKNRDAVQKALTEAKIGTTVHYPTPLPFLQAYARLGHQPADFPIAWRNHLEMLSLPLYPEMPLNAQDRVVEVIRSVSA